MTYTYEQALAAFEAKKAGGGVMDQTRIQPKKIERRCPRCGRHAYHWLTWPDTESNKTSRPVAGCANCGHEWPCRVMGRDL